MGENIESVKQQKTGDEAIGYLNLEGANAETRRLALAPSNMGVINHSSGRASLMGRSGNSISVDLYLNGVVVEEVSFQATGQCGYSIACASAATLLIHDRPLSHALNMTSELIERKLGGVPDEYHHVAVLAAEVVKAAARDALNKLSDPLRLMYLS